jgi:futalosine hydrolase
MAPSSLLVIAATAHELASPDGWAALLCGVGPVDAAVATAAAIALSPPTAILHVGIAGARRARGLAPASLVIGSASLYCDLVIPAHFAPRTVDASPLLLAAARQAFPDAPVLPIGTSARVGGTTECDVEAMEGFGVLRAAQQAGIPALEVRVIANAIEETDRARWHFAEAFAEVTRATPLLVRALREALDHA